MPDVDIVVWIVVILLMLIGLAGSVLPVLPGTTLILVGALLQKWLLPDTLSWFAVGWIAAFWLVSVVSDIACTLLGTKWFGGGRWGMAGATGGAMVGMFFSLPTLLLATIFGAFVAERWMGKRSTEQALKAGAGAAIGFLVSTVLRLICAIVMIALYVVAVLSAVPHPL